MRLSIIAASLLSAFSALPVFAADEPASPHTVTANVAAASEYIYRGIGQTNRNPAIQGGADYSHSSGVYVGVWGSNISWLSDGKSNVSAPAEFDFYGGYKFEAGPLGMDFGLLQYAYPGSYPTGFVSPNTTEIYGAASYKFVTFKYSHSVTSLFGFEAVGDNGQTRETRGSKYFDLSANPELGAGFTLNLHVGRQKVAHIKSASYNDWKVGITKAFDGGWSVSAAYIETNAKKEVYTNAFGKNLGAGRAVLTLARSF